MKTKLLLFVLLLFTGMIIVSCNQKNRHRPDAAVVSAFNNKFPQAKQIDWDPKHGYEVAEFNDNGVRNEAWFDSKGKWLMTESDLKYSALPQAIRNHFEKSTYQNWKKDGIEKIERKGMAPVYIIELEKENQDTYLYYTAEGRLIKTLDHANRHNDGKFMPLNPVIQDKIARKYPDATVIETDTERGKLEIDILDNGKSKEMIFNGENWVSTSWKVNKSEVPSAVMDAFRDSEYGKYRIDDIYFYETPDNSYYFFELEQGNKEVKFSVKPDGTIIK